MSEMLDRSDWQFLTIVAAIMHAQRIGMSREALKKSILEAQQLISIIQEMRLADGS